ncbi:hypothetical protein V498_09089, partial [Pseudogymnoascus sp. VKM F-4517 (FW-2822)]
SFPALPSSFHPLSDNLLVVPAVPAIPAIPVRDYWQPPAVHEQSGEEWSIQGVDITESIEAHKNPTTPFSTTGLGHA